VNLDVEWDSTGTETMEREEQSLLEEAEEVFREEPKLIHLPNTGKAIFVGDTHGDLEASRSILEGYLSDHQKVVFLGDYVDRGEASRENILYLLSMKLQFPEDVIILMGNHEGYIIKEFYPAHFWLSLTEGEKERYGKTLAQLPYAVSTPNGVIGVHGSLPDVEKLEDIDRIQTGDENWDQIVWGDFQDRPGNELGEFWGRPQYGRDYFCRIMDQFEKQVLIRSHQPNANPIMFEKRCLTIFTSYAYMPIRTVALVDLTQEKVESIDDIVLEMV
jgi:predicted phosphodiesterase